MEIYLPKTDTDASKTGGDDTGWESIVHTSQTQKEAIVAFEKYLSILSERLRKIDILFYKVFLMTCAKGFIDFHSVVKKAFMVEAQKEVLTQTPTS